MGRGLARQHHRKGRGGPLCRLTIPKRKNGRSLLPPKVSRGCAASRTTCVRLRILFSRVSRDVIASIADKAEVSVDFPDKAYIGHFSRHSQFDAYADADNVAIRLVRPREDRREAVVHLHYGLLADILCELARSPWPPESPSMRCIAASSTEPSEAACRRPRTARRSSGLSGPASIMRKKPPYLLLVLSLAACFIASPAFADPTKGAQIARQWCANCHLIGGGVPAGPVPQGPPNF